MQFFLPQRPVSLRKPWLMRRACTPICSSASLAHSGEAMRQQCGKIYVTRQQDVVGLRLHRIGPQYLNF